MWRYLIATLISFALALILARALISWQQRRGLGQPIRDYGPEMHEHKRGTPTMGGLALLVAWVLLMPLLLLILSEAGAYLIVSFGVLGFGLIGLLDDGLKFYHRNSTGLPGRYKLFGQLVLGTAFFALLTAQGPLPGLIVPFSDLVLSPHPFVYFLITVLVMISTVNAFNETDGLDGLLCGTTLIALAAFAAITTQLASLDLLGIVLIGAGLVMGLLWWNVYPARIFMGDTGSFALGALIGGLALITGTALFLPLIALIPVLETLSVMLQVASFKLFKVRIFKVSPLHHHFERARGADYKYLLPTVEWPEPTITQRFWVVNALGALVGVGGALAHLR